jgi:hypothetical protein
MSLLQKPELSGNWKGAVNRVVRAGAEVGQIEYKTKRKARVVARAFPSS